MRTSIAIVVVVVACDKSEPPTPPAPSASAATVQVVTTVPETGTYVVAEIGTMSVPHPAAGTVTVTFTGVTRKVCRTPPCIRDLQLGLCENPAPATPSLIETSCRGSHFSTDQSWTGGVGEPLVLDQTVSLTHTTRVDAAGTTQFRLVGRTSTAVPLHGQLTAIYAPGPALAVTTSGFAPPKGSP